MPNSYTFSALVLGATGQVGREIVKELVKNERIPKVTLLVRKHFDLLSNQNAEESKKYEKIKEHIIDFDKLPEYSDLFIDHDVVFCALGTHSNYASDRNLFYKVDHHYVLDSAKLAKDAGCHHFVVITMKGANPHSRLFFCKVKGEVEEDLKGIHFYRLSIYRPGFLLSNTNKHRGRERNSWLFSTSSFLLSKLDLWRHVSIYDYELAKVMVQQCFAPKQSDVEVYENKMIHTLARS